MWCMSVPAGSQWPTLAQHVDTKVLPDLRLSFQTG